MKSTIRYAAFAVISAMVSATGWAAPTLSVGTASGSPGNAVDVAVTFNPGADSVASIQFDLTLPSALTAVSMTEGPALSAAGKGLAASVNGQTWRVVIFGLNQTAIGAGTLATARVTIAAGTAAGNLSLPVSGVVYANSSGVAIVPGTSTAGMVTVTGSADTTPPSAPTNLTFSSIGSTSMLLSWTASPQSDVAGYLLDLSLNSGFTTFVPGYQDLNIGKVTSRSLTGLSPDTLYYARLRAYDTSGNPSTPSQVMSARTAPAPANRAPVVSAITANPGDVNPATQTVEVYEGTTITYSASASDPDGDALTWEWLYKVNGGAEASFRSGAGAVQPVSFSYPLGSAPLVYEWILRARDGQATAQQSLLIFVIPRSGTTPPPSSTLDLSAIEGKTFSLNEVISFEYSDSAQFFWSFEPVSAPLSSLGGSKKFGAPAPFATTTGSPRLPLGSYDLRAGKYILRVRAEGSQTRTGAANITLVSPDLDGVKVFPNPWKASQHTGGITFDNLTANVSLKIFTVSGQLVREFSGVSGTLTWNLKNESGDRVGSGVYIYLLEGGQGAKRRGKLAIVK